MKSKSKKNGREKCWKLGRKHLDFSRELDRKNFKFKILITKLLRDVFEDVIK